MFRIRDTRVPCDTCGTSNTCEGAPLPTDCAHLAVPRLHAPHNHRGSVRPIPPPLAVHDRIVPPSQVIKAREANNPHFDFLFKPFGADNPKLTYYKWRCAFPCDCAQQVRILFDGGSFWQRKAI